MICCEFVPTNVGLICGKNESQRWKRRLLYRCQGDVGQLRVIVMKDGSNSLVKTTNEIVRFDPGIQDGYPISGLIVKRICAALDRGMKWLRDKRGSGQIVRYPDGITGLQFYRRHQALEDLKNERPKSISAVRQALREAVDKMETELQTIERDFYGGATCDDDIRSVKPHVRRLCAAFNVTYIHGSYQLDEILAQCRDLADDDENAIERQTVEMVSRYEEKIRNFVPSKFEDMIRDAEEMIGFMEKYLLSYYNSNSNNNSNSNKTTYNSNSKKQNKNKDDQYLETAIHYEEKRHELKDAILSHLRNITYMSRMYYDKGTPVKVFGLAINELARRRDCGDLPFLLIFPQCCQNIRNACHGIRKWIESDEQYAAFLACDVADLDQKRAEQLRRMRDAQHSHYVVEHRLKRVAGELGELTGELERLKERELDNEKQVQQLEAAVQLMALEVETLEEQREEIRNKEQPDANRLGTIASRISRLRYSIPAKNGEISDVKAKTSFIADKRELHASKLKQFAQLQHDVTYTKMAAAIEEVEMDCIVRCLERLRYIYLRKISPASTRHIFHNTTPKVKVHVDKVKPTQGRILKPSRRQIEVEDKDELEKVARLVARRIDGDWPKLYRNLPFYPPRGRHNIDDDVSSIVRERMRVADRVKAEASLEKWRRVHTRANVDDLKETLMKMNRPDVINSLERQKRQRHGNKNDVQKKWQNLRTLQLITSRITRYKSSRMVNASTDQFVKKVRLPKIAAGKGT
ncbi:hypothetical protein LSH36_535g03018 [Paralvinella palmiformis]|uniref:Death domain-containing protein n=1 Tax=Paralvinella palmiformis TaxID=53620 RepID=A0AAD9MVZ0_9ANNE|nr:hypothetical protein LSH36_535g03018 [Paralvinella palmiformis]